MSKRPVSTAEPRYMGGQAVMEGVMMRGTRSWAVAVRTPEGEIEVVTHEAPTWAERWVKVPLMRGVMGLGESMALGFKALSWSAERQIPEEERISSKAMGFTMGFALLLFTAIFILIPAFINNGVANYFGVEGFAFHLVEGAIRLGIFLGYLLLIGQIKDIKRVFQYHGAEHKAIAAYENDVEVTAEEAQKFLHRARALWHQLLAHRDGGHDLRVLVCGPAVAAVSHPEPDHPDPAHRRHRVRGDPVLGPPYAVGGGCGC